MQTGKARCLYISSSFKLNELKGHVCSCTCVCVCVHAWTDVYIAAFHPCVIGSRSIFMFFQNEVIQQLFTRKGRSISRLEKKVCRGGSTLHVNLENKGWIYSREGESEGARRSSLERDSWPVSCLRQNLIPIDLPLADQDLFSPEEVLHQGATDLGEPSRSCWPEQEASPSTHLRLLLGTLPSQLA